MPETCLVVGATGLLGFEVARALRARNVAVAGLVRPDSPPPRVSALQKLGVRTIEGDLRDRESLRRACTAVRSVVSTASAAMARKPEDTLTSVDTEGQLALVSAAREAGVRMLAYVSIPDNPLGFQLQRAKRSVEEALRRSGMAYTILRPSNFMEVWLSPALGFDLRAGQVRIFGDGTRPTSWVSYLDVARLLVAAVESRELEGASLSLGGPDAMSYRDVINLAMELGVPAPEVSFVDEATLRAALASARTEFEQTSSALMLTAALGQVVDSSEAVARAPGARITVRQFLTQSTSATNNEVRS
jgi:uncharacterized protein YbjT (DUF2867 family)